MPSGDEGSARQLQISGSGNNFIIRQKDNII